MKMKAHHCCLFLVSLLVTSILAQTNNQTNNQTYNPPHHNEAAPPVPREEQIRRILPALPEHLQKDATIYVKEASGYVLAKQGTNGFTCADLGGPNAPAPHCWDREGTETIFQATIRFGELRGQGKTAEEIVKALAEDYRTGKLRAPSKPGISYMLSGENFGLGPNWYPPHVMFYTPYMKNAELGAIRETPAGRRLPWILGAGFPGAYLIATNRPPEEKIEPKTPPPIPKPTKDGLPPLLGREREIELALSAGPENIRKDATVYVLERGGYVKARAGTNGFTCLVVREGQYGTAPNCYDPEGSQTHLLATLRRTELREQGKSAKEVERLIAEEYYTGKLSAPRKSGVAFMLSGENYLADAETGKLFWYPPHYRVYMPYVKNADLGALPEHVGSYYLPWILNEGRPDACAVIVTPDKRQELKTSAK